MKEVPLGRLAVICLFAVSNFAVADNPPQTTQPPSEAPAAACLDYTGFKTLANKVAPIRAQRRVSAEAFNKMAREPKTVILDTRSKKDYDERHIKGALHINYADLNQESLQELIPDKDTRVLIYCLNNFSDTVHPVDQLIILPAIPLPAEFKPPKSDVKKPKAHPNPWNAHAFGEFKAPKFPPVKNNPKHRSMKPLAIASPTSNKANIALLRDSLMLAPENHQSNIITPATYETIVEKILISESPPEYREITKRIMITPPVMKSSPPPTRTADIPSEYKTIKKRVMVEPPTTRSVTIPGKYRTITRKQVVVPGATPPAPEPVLAEEPQTRVTRIPGKYETVTRYSTESTPPSHPKNDLANSKEIETPLPRSTRVDKGPERFAGPPIIKESKATDFVKGGRLVDIPARYDVHTVRVEVKGPTIKEEPPTYSTSVALNIPTYIALAGHGYENVYEFADVVPWNSDRLEFAGSTVTTLPYYANAAAPPQTSAPKPRTIQYVNDEHMDFEGFLKQTDEFEERRKKRLISAKTFNTMAGEPNTVILDVRSKTAFNRKHIKGAIHLNFSEFDEVKLEKLIPYTDTRILIYCDNNFEGGPTSSFSPTDPALALNLPTFIQLLAYGYKNTYELGEIVPEATAPFAFEGTDVQ